MDTLKCAMPVQRSCTVEGCDKPTRSLGFCNVHYVRNRRYGDPLFTKIKVTRSMPFEERWAAQTKRVGDCIEWIGPRMPRGYGNATYEGKGWIASRLAWHTQVGPIPPGMHVLHKCDNPPCVNVDHLYIGDHRQNMDDMLARGRRSGFYNQPGHNVGSKHPLARLTEADVLDIRTAAASGRTQREIAKAYGISVTTVSAIVLRRSWRHI